MNILIKGKTGGHALEDSHAVLIVSIDSDYNPEKPSLSSPYEGERFDAICAELSKNFKAITVVVADTLQRYNLMLDGMTESEAEDCAKKMGDKWLKRNRPESKLSNLKDILRWDQFIKCDDYIETKKMFDNLYTQVEACKKAIDSSAGEFVRRYISKKILNVGTCSEEEKAKAIEFSRLYAKEESSVINLWKEYDWRFILYPCNKLNQGIYYAIKKFVQSKDPNKFLHLEIVFEPEKKANLASYKRKEPPSLPPVNFLFTNDLRMPKSKQIPEKTADVDAIQHFTTVLAASIAQQVTAFAAFSRIDINPEYILRDLAEKLKEHTNPIQINAPINFASDATTMYSDGTIHMPGSPPKANC